MNVLLIVGIVAFAMWFERRRRAVSVRRTDRLRSTQSRL
jgi:hypothetical protein